MSSIKDMTRGQLIDELISHYYEQLNTWDEEDLRETLIKHRVKAYERELYREAGILHPMYRITE